MPHGPHAERGTQDELAPGGEPVALAALIDRGVKLDWHEAVAVVRDVCHLLRGTDPDEPVPDLRHIWICANGRMAIAPGTVGDRTSTEHPVATLGRLLLSLVEDAGMPVQLRIVALSAASTTPAYATVDEFSNALAYFERPGGAPPVRPVYNRWYAQAAESDAPTALQPLPPASPPRTSPSPVPQEVVDLTAPPDALDLFLPEKKVVALRGRSFPVLPIAAAAAGLLVVTLILAWSFSGRSGSSPGPAQTAQAPVEETASEAIAQTSPVAKDIDLDATGASTARGSGARRSGLASGVATRNRVGKAGAAPAIPSARPPVRSASRFAGPAPASPASPSSRQPAADERLPVPMGEPPNVIYSSADQDVDPPILVRPRVSVDPPAAGERQGMTVLDLLISETGQVETVKLAAPAQDYREAMIISAIKTWKFTPGMRDGHPVRYQKRIWIRISPIGTLVR